MFHITHWKAGSQWIHRIFQGLVYERLVLPVVGMTQFLRTPIQPGKVYPTLYVTKEEFDSVAMPANCRRFVVMRDLRDTLVSLYFSHKFSHALLNEEFVEIRRALEERDEEEGLLFILEGKLALSANIQRSWLKSGEPFIRYEDLLENNLPILEDVLLRHCELRVSPERLREVAAMYRFERASGGRRLGEVDVNAHERQGLPGDWRNHFTDRVRRSFQNRYGELLVDTGYERDLDR